MAKKFETINDAVKQVIKAFSEAQEAIEWIRTRYTEVDDIFDHNVKWNVGQLEYIVKQVIKLAEETIALLELNESKVIEENNRLKEEMLAKWHEIVNRD